jgi:hypothetical protein
MTLMLTGISFFARKTGKDGPFFSWYPRVNQ